ncbi:hypothetical protein BKA66DRAFT_479149 [Pyrenochaeta sp. MPI-SDFR-AT-0127]|nr:hypothetical protein BKA66DRAFT_479149 [Pyrenochaeta sp. MPI-SDFR-AT-0127]
MASNMVPNYEVKLLMKPSVVLGSDDKLENTVLSTFSMPASVKKINVQFLDTDTRQIYDRGWSPRIRKMEGDDDFELTYKKRYSISDGHDGKIEDNIDAALTLAKNEGFDSTTTYRAQVELGHRKETLSISHEVSYRNSSSNEIKLPDESVSREILISNAPGMFKNWSSENWGTKKLAASRIYGPIRATRSKGKWEGMSLFIEVWPIKKSRVDTRIEHIVEASFKTPSLPTALQEREKLAAFLQSKDWLLAGDSSKTSLIMERY